MSNKVTLSIKKRITLNLSANAPTVEVKSNKGGNEATVVYPPPKMGMQNIPLSPGDELKVHDDTKLSILELVEYGAVITSTTPNPEATTTPKPEQKPKPDFKVEDRTSDKERS